MDYAAKAKKVAKSIKREKSEKVKHGSSWVETTENFNSSSIFTNLKRAHQSQVSDDQSERKRKVKFDDELEIEAHVKYNKDMNTESNKSLQTMKKADAMTENVGDELDNISELSGVSYAVSSLCGGDLNLSQGAHSIAPPDAGQKKGKKRDGKKESPTNGYRKNAHKPKIRRDPKKKEMKKPKTAVRPRNKKDAKKPTKEATKEASGATQTYEYAEIATENKIPRSYVIIAEAVPIESPATYFPQLGNETESAFPTHTISTDFYQEEQEEIETSIITDDDDLWIDAMAIAGEIFEQ